MAVKTKSKDRVLNMVYSLGAAVVILGALFKINHWSLGPVDGSSILAIGLIVEAFIFVVFAFDPPAGDYEWEKAFPELLDGKPVERKQKLVETPQQIKEVEVSLSSKLDQMFSQAKLDVNMLEKLRSGIENFGQAVEGINKTVDANLSVQKYNDQLSKASSHLENLNALYQVQLDSGKKFTEDLVKAGEHSTEFKDQLNTLTTNLNNLNKVYGGMLNAMKS
ncbi:gliding motility protein GldL [Apibacter muscae]|uniref:Gliding motility protein GldL n=1 Tax=Apibacter muscae TaxID=2509004 RepID=A0A563DCF9_9FLAO|nr:gliding motility protein GldL [Apibacter muscae]TWP23553.1 gliding motility protein GldL [Apibacter muscae]TWP27464.1 gliding motility protein GldL [Apibacter muscae]TWP28878.1 gliding motility protein GldL [Apibacter muscae]